MNPKFFLLAVSLLTVSALPANAEGNRWDFAPNVYKADSVMPHTKRVSVAPHSVAPSSMPHSSAFLGINPSMLKPPAPVAPPQQNVQAIVSVPQTQAAPFRNDFGAPISATPKAMPSAMPPKAMAMAPVHSSNNVNGRLRTPIHSVSNHAKAASLPTIANYGGGNGYTPGVVAPPVSSGSSTDTKVNGRIVGLGH